tara:strand:+ start:453 stop:974 length:522 start_codon:yes stop_codon:yes gene_type:complete
MNTEKIIKISIIFLIGFLSANLLSFYFVYGLETPLSFNNFSLFNGSASNTNDSAPFDFIDEDQIKIYDDKIIIYIKDASLSRYAPTGSMLPLLDEGSNGIRIVPDSEQEIHIGDIITFDQRINGQDYLIVHRVIDKGTDSEGVYFITKGDNTSIDDGKIRFKNIKYITIGVIW